MVVNFVLVNYNGAIDTVNCISSIINNKLDCEIFARIIIVDNDSYKDGIDDIYRLLKSNLKLHEISENIYRVDYSYEIVFIKSAKNGGFGHGNNLGLLYLKKTQYTSNDIVVLLNNDTEVPSHFINLIVSYFNEINTGLVALSVKSLNYFTKDIDSEGFAYINSFTGRSSHKHKYQYSYLVGSCIIMNNIKQIPLFDENFFLYYEDADYSNLLRKAGYLLTYDANNYFFHKVNASTKTNTNIEAIKKESMIRFMRKNVGLLNNICFISIRIIVYLLTGSLSNIRKLLHGYTKPL